MRKAYFLHRDWVAALFFWQYTIVLEESDVCKARITTAARQKRSVVPFIFEWCCAADRADVCWGQWGREEKVAVVPELNRCMIKRSQGHIKRWTKSGGLYVSALEHGGVLVFLGFFYCRVFMCVCVSSSSPEKSGSMLAEHSPMMFGWVPVEAGEQAAMFLRCEWVWEPSRQTGRQYEQEESGEDCLLTGVLLICYLVLDSYPQQH